jgi:hypothetical protein
LERKKRTHGRGPSKATPPDPRTIAAGVIDDARFHLPVGPASDWNAHASLVLFALARALDRGHAGLGKLASRARDVLDEMGAPDDRMQPVAERTDVAQLGVGVDEQTHRTFVLEKTREIVLYQQLAMAKTDKKKPPPLPAIHMAQALSRVLGAGPLRGWYKSEWRWEKDGEAHDGDAERIVSAWSKWVAADGCIHVDEEPTKLARKLVVDALIALGVERKRALDGFAPKALRKKKVSKRVRR